MKNKYLYVLIDKHDPYEIPIFVGTLTEMAEYTHTRKPNIIRSVKNTKSKYKKVKVDDQ